MKKILFVFNHPAPYKVRLFNELAKHFDLNVVFERDSASDRNSKFYAEKKFHFNLFKIKGIKIGRENFISSGIKNHLKKNNYDLVIMNGYSTFAEMKAIRYLKKHNIPYCFYINGGISKLNESKFKKNLKTKYISGASFYMSPDERSNEYLKYYGASVDKIYNYPYSTIYENEIISKFASEDEKKLIKQKYLIDAKEIFVSCGQLIDRKNYIQLIKSWPKDNDKLLLIIGDGKQRSLIEKLLKEKNIKNVKLLGYLNREAEFELYKIADAFVFPSKEDIYGHVVNEAMSQGLPVISTKNVNSSLKLIKEGQNGLLIDNVDEKTISDALLKIKNCSKEASINTAKENTIEKMVSTHIEIFSKLNID